MPQKWLCFAILFSTAYVPNGYGNEIPRDVAVRILVSEAADQGLKGMICVGEVLHHRGSIKGFYGYRSNYGKHLSRSVWEAAGRAWDISRRTNYTKGADHFENIHRFGKPWWVRSCIKTYEYKDHVFYKEMRLTARS